ncbi:hypothetical protein K503DRAFT_191512 [Rhizopogon vinicolor AM-OR11-026]|uniref:Uncharacterized protein n=1 Tax=Rhizopogon vinicolor AM-OR11-026 TaxID=1314800 RepID=A0A1B7MZD4_9AGAM|nr:hypothetical protein K503DRAFT_191512 [Rhizopogon vinicolor AM-OR11-026]
MTLQPKKVLSPMAAASGTSSSSAHELIHISYLNVSIKHEAMFLQKIIACDCRCLHTPDFIGSVLLECLSFSEHPFPVIPSSLFPTFVGTNAYLKAFALPFIESGHIRLRREEIEVEEIDGGGWVVERLEQRRWDGIGRNLGCGGHHDRVV